MRVRTGLIGFGLAGKALHAPLIAAEPRLALAAVVTSRVAEVAERHPTATVLPTAAALLADPAIDLVVIATPNHLHAPLARAALEANKHVVVDKPFVTDLADARSLIELARERGRMLSVFHNRRWDGDFLTVARLVRERTLGDVMLAKLHWDRFRPAIKRGWREVPGDGAGLLADLGPHLVDQALQLFGMPETVTAGLAAQRAEAAVDDYFTLSLGYGALRVRLGASTLVADPRPRFALHGTRGSFVKHGVDPQEAVLRAGGSPDDAGFGDEPPESNGRLTIGDLPGERVATERGVWRCFYAGVAAAVLDGAPPPVAPEEALTGLHLLALARRSAAEGRTLSA